MVDELLALVGVDPRENSTSLLKPILGDEPTRREGEDDQASNQHEDRTGELQAEGKPPLQVTLKKDTAIADPVGQEEARRRAHALEPDDYAAVLGLGDLGHVDGGDGQDHPRGPASEEPSCDEHADVGPDDGQEDAYDGDGARNCKSVSPAKSIGGPACEQGANSLPGVVHGDDGTCVGLFIS